MSQSNPMTIGEPRAVKDSTVLCLQSELVPPNQTWSFLGTHTPTMSLSARVQFNSVQAKPCAHVKTGPAFDSASGYLNFDFG
jgi:hypothetical protein